ncbi:MAG: hypothetical protein VYD64_04510 [Pseudomonadota bacterium]|nr:hypothetical protein [Pseudomonadota bacterium]
MSPQISPMTTLTPADGDRDVSRPATARALGATLFVNVIAIVAILSAGYAAFDAMV